MAKKKPAVKMPVKKPAAKKAAAKKPVAKAPPKKVAPMAKKAPAKKVAVPAKKPAKKAAPAPKKPLPKKVEKKPAAPAKKAAPAPAKKSLASQVVKGASKLIAKVVPKAPTKEQLKAQKEKEAKEKKLAAEKLKAQEAEAKKKAKELEKKKKEDEKASAKKAKAAAKPLKKKGKKSDDDEEDFDDEDDDLDDEDYGDEDLGEEEEEKPKAKAEDDDFDEFEEDYKKAKAAKKPGKKAYEEDIDQTAGFTPKQAKKYNSAVLADLEGKIADEIAELREHFNWKEITEAIGTMDFFIDAKNDECIEKGCDNIRTTQSYCRLHYLKNWKGIQKKRDILKDGKLQEYIEELISKYPVKYIEALLSDLSDDKEFYKVLNELNITSEFDFEEDEFENAVDDDDDGDDIGIETISTSLRYEDE